MFKSLKGRLGLLFTAFVLLVLVSAGATVWGLEAQRQDALVINLAGRQRMLTQQMARLAFLAGRDQESANRALQETAQTFEQTIQALRVGGEAPYIEGREVVLPAARQPEIVSTLEQTALTWDKYRRLLKQLQTLSQNDPAFQAILQSVQATAPVLAQQTDKAVRLYEAESTRKVNRLRLIQASFLTGALLLLGLGVWVTRQSVLVPLDQLSQAARRIGQRDLDSPVQAKGLAEFQVLSQSFDAMRQNLKASRRELMELNAGLEKHIRLRTQELEALGEISQEVNSQLNLQRVLELVTEKARTLVGGEVAFLCLVDDSQRWLKLQAVSGPPESVNSHMQPGGGERGMALEAENLSACGVQKCQGMCKALIVQYRASHLAAPLQAGKRVIGALCVGSRVAGQFGGEAEHLLSRLSNIAAIALENARLYGQAEHLAVMEERRRVAAEMHDGLGQTLSYLGLVTDQVGSLVSTGQNEAALAHLRQARETMQKATGEVRQAIDNLMSDAPPAVLDLSVHLRNAAAELIGNSDLPVTWESETGFAFNCPRQVSEQVLKIAREALKNVARHARAQQVILRVGETAGHYFISVQDNGQGFDAVQPPPQGHFGLQVMRARADVIGGQIKIESAPGTGTKVTLTWPLTGKGERYAQHSHPAG